MAFKNKQTILAEFFPAKRSSSKLILSKVTNLSRNHFLFLPQIFPPIFDYSVALENCLKYCLKTLKHVFLPFSAKWSKICFNHKNVWFFSDFLIPFFIGSYHRNWVFIFFLYFFNVQCSKKNSKKFFLFFGTHNKNKQGSTLTWCRDLLFQSWPVIRGLHPNRICALKPYVGGYTVPTWFWYGTSFT